MAFRFKIQLRDISHPPVWRKILVPEDFTFLRFHQVIQAAFGWEDAHLFQFSANGYRSDTFIEIPDPDDLFPSSSEKPDASAIKLSDIFNQPQQRYTYIYDMGDDWLHIITLEAITTDKSARAEYLDEKGTCPPEDCGDHAGYADMKKNIG